MSEKLGTIEIVNQAQENSLAESSENQTLPPTTNQPLIEVRELFVRAFYKLYTTSDSEGKCSGKDFAFDISRQDFVKRGDHYDFKLTKIPGDFGFIGFIDADLGNQKYRISIIKADEYRRMDGDILQAALDLPIDSAKCVKRLLFGPKSIIAKGESELPYAFVSDHILITQKDNIDFIECERMLLWFFHKQTPIDQEKLLSLVNENLEHKKKFHKFKKGEDIINYYDKAVINKLIQSIFQKSSGLPLSRDLFAQFWSIWGIVREMIIKTGELWSTGKVFGITTSIDQVYSILQNQSIKSFVIHIPTFKSNVLAISYVKSEFPTTIIEHQEWTSDEVSEQKIVKFVYENCFTRYYLSELLWTNTKWGDVRRSTAADICNPSVQSSNQSN